MREREEEGERLGERETWVETEEGVTVTMETRPSHYGNQITGWTWRGEGSLLDSALFTPLVVHNINRSY